MVRRNTVNTVTRSAFNFLLDLLYPPRCGGCGKFGEGWWCATCNSRTKWLDVRECARQIPLESGQSLTVIAAGIFAPPLREGIHALKYESTPQLADAFAHPMVEVWKANEMTSDLIVPVPLHASRQRERGFNQSELLAKHISHRTDTPLELKALHRVRRTEQQVQLSAEERKANVRGAFVADAVIANGKHILLVDDVLTTGATLAECAEAVFAAGARGVVALTLARAQS